MVQFQGHAGDEEVEERRPPSLPSAGCSFRFVRFFSDSLRIRLGPDFLKLGCEGPAYGRRFLCPENKRGAKTKSGRKKVQPRDPSHQRRLERKAFYQSPRGRALYRRRGQTIEPFNEWFKSLFELEDRVWHRGLQNNQTQLLAALFSYQLLVRYNHRRGHKNGRVRWILDTLNSRTPANNWQKTSSFSELADQGKAAVQVAAVPEPMTLPLPGISLWFLKRKRVRTRI